MADNIQPSIKTQQDRDAATAGAAVNNAVNRTAAQAQDTARQSAQALQHGGQVASDAARRTVEATADATRRAAEAGADATRRAADAASEATRRTATAFAESQRDFAQTAAKQFEDVSRKMAEATHGTTENLRAMMVLPNAANGGMQDLHQSMTGLVEGVVRTNLRAAQELFQHTNPAALVEMQQRFVREYLDTLMQGTATLIRATRRAADETLKPIEQQIEQRHPGMHAAAE